MRQEERTRSGVPRGRRLRLVWTALLVVWLGGFAALVAVQAAPTQGEANDLPSFALPNIMAIGMSLAVLAIACMRYQKD